MEKKGFKRFLLFLLAVFFLTFPAHAEQQSGWFKKGSFYHPYVKVSSCKGRIALFVNSKGQVYKGVCRRDRERRGYVLSPRKKFLYKEPLRYFVLRINGHDAPTIIRIGILGD